MKKLYKTSSVFKCIIIVADSLLFSLLLTFPVGLILPASNRVLIRLLLCVGVFGTVLLIRRKRNGSVRKRKEAERFRQRKFNEFLMSDDETLSALTGQKRFHLIRREHPDRFDVIDAIRAGATAVGLLSDDKKISSLIGTSFPNVRIYNMNDLFASAIEKETKRKRSDRFFCRRVLPVNKYFILGMCFFIVSFLFGYKIYFRLVSCLCWILAPISDIFGDCGVLKKFRIFLDNTGNR